jgi:hypothetical protein
MMMTRHPPRPRPELPKPMPPAAPAPDHDHDPAPVDLGCESVAGEEDPGASLEPPDGRSPRVASAPASATRKGSGRAG